MISRLAGLALLILLPLSQAVALTDTEREAVIRAEDYLESVETLQADFIQQAESGATANGTLKMKRPGLIRFQYAPPAKILMVSDGTLVSFIDYEVGQLTQWPLFDTPLAHLVREELDLLNQTLVDEVAIEPGFVRFRLRNPNEPDQGWIRFHFSDTPMRLLGWDLSDAQGQVTTVALTNPVVNAELDRRAFDFETPKAPWDADR